MLEALPLLAPVEHRVQIQDWLVSANARVQWLPQAHLLEGAAPFGTLLLFAAGPQGLEELAQSGVVAKLAASGAVVVLQPAPHAISNLGDMHGEEGLELVAEAALLAQGAQAVLAIGGPMSQAHAARAAQDVRQAALRWQAQRSRMLAYATDVHTGLPHETQLLEHASQLLALRERQPGPLVIIALRVQGLTRASERLGGEASNVLRRKVAVRLRAGLRASDVVASLGPDSFAVLLAHVDSANDGHRVAAKLVKSLQQPFTVAGQVCTVAASVGVAHAPEHGKDARALLQRANAQAEGLATMADNAARPELPRVATLVQLPIAGSAAANDGAAPTAGA